MQMSFYRYQDAEGIPNVRRMPRSDIKATTAPRTICELFSRLEDYSKDEEAYRAKYPWASRFVMGYPLPQWQRPLVWDDGQKERFVTSLWMEVDVGSYLVNETFEFVEINGIAVDVCKEFTDILLDGQQRLSALEDYFFGRIAIPDADGVPTYWNELSKVERRLFGNQTFNRSIVSCNDEAQLRLIYDMRAFGGTPHSADQRASPIGPK